MVIDHQKVVMLRGCMVDLTLQTSMILKNLALETEETKSNIKDRLSTCDSVIGNQSIK